MKFDDIRFSQRIALERKYYRWLNEINKKKDDGCLAKDCPTTFLVWLFSKYDGEIIKRKKQVFVI